KSIPANNQTEVKSNKIEIEFDEIIQLDNASEKVVISPPQNEMPKIKATGKKIYIELEDSLLPNTTYAIDFSDAIKDNNEGNILNGFSLAFSTGSSIDSMQISGTILNAENLEPLTGMIIGVHTNLEDSAFTTIPFRRISRSDAYGKFTIRNLARGNYRIFGLKDADRNYTFNNPSEEIAFYPQIITPSVTEESISDTIKTAITKKDSITIKKQLHYTPDTLILLSFSEGYKPQYLSKIDRTYRNRFTITFATRSDKLPVLKPLNFTPTTEDWNILERSIKNDTLTYWIKDSLIYNKDTLKFAAEYNITDSLLNTVQHNDTLSFVFRAPKIPKKSKKEIDSIQVKYMTITPKIGNPMEVYSTPTLVFSEPVARLKRYAVKLQEKKDSIWVDEKDFTFTPDTLSPRTYILKYKWSCAKEYKFTIDSLGATSIYGDNITGIEEKIRIRKSEEYSNLYIETVGITSGAFVELLDKSDKPVRFATIHDGGAEFVYVRPGTYYARLTIDKENKRVFTTGKYSEQKQPERVYYYPKTIELKPNWDVEQTWDVFATPVNQQKPRAITKNKPVDHKNDSEADIKDKENNPIYTNRPTTKLKY
ncbi:MAG: Ig-like domain-containing protein, partial [Bacteroidales bacterium]